MKPVVNLYKLGRLPYVKALDVQQALFAKLKGSVVSVSTADDTQSLVSNSVDPGGIYHRSNPNWRTQSSLAQENVLENSLVLVEHAPVYTIGIRSKLYDNDYVVKLKEELNKHDLNADLFKTNRGGLITFHGPGQLVAYPIIYLGDFKNTIHNRSVKAYVKALEVTIIDTLAALGLKGAHTVPEYPGVWLNGGERKIAFIGISLSCGIEDKSITSVERELLKTEIQPNRRYLSPNTNGPLQIQSDQPFKITDPDEKLNEIQENSKCPKSSVEHVSSVFCKAFSHHFDCNLIETEYFLSSKYPEL